MPSNEIGTGETRIVLLYILEKVYLGVDNPHNDVRSSVSFESKGAASEGDFHAGMNMASVLGGRE
jgi:hypothetical protein